MTAPPAPLAILGAGSWGTALAVHIGRHGHPVRLWGRDPQRQKRLLQERRNERYLPGVDLPPAVQPCTRLDQALDGAGDILVAVPSESFREVLEAISRRGAGHRLAWATKGLEHGTGILLHEVAADVLTPDVPTAVISGPTFAREVALGLPTAVTVASLDLGFADDLVNTLHDDRFRAYRSDDITGVELGGAIKNVLAIAAGAGDGLGLGANTRAALITRGLAEMMRLGEALGGRRETFMGLAGLGDLVLTCTDDQSRNRRLGAALARGGTLEDTKASIGQAVEGIRTAAEVMRRARAAGIEMPISEQVYAVLHEQRDLRAAVQNLLEREPRPELE